MNVADSILLALADAPGDRTPALILADWLEERDTPAARALAPLVRLAAQKRTADWRKRMAAGRAALAAPRPRAAGWFDWWFGTRFGPTYRLLREPERLALTSFGMRCVRDLPAGDRTVFGQLADEASLHAVACVERHLAGELLPEDDREKTRQGLWIAARVLHVQNDPLMYPIWAVIMLYDMAFPGTTAWTAAGAAEACARYSLRAAYEVPPVLRRKVSPEAIVLGLLRATVPCPFDPESDP